MIELNERQLRVLDALLQGPLMREAVDEIAGSSNGPHDIQVIRVVTGKLELKCRRIPRIDRDGRRCRPGRYFLTELGRKRAVEYLEQRAQLLLNEADDRRSPGAAPSAYSSRRTARPSVPASARQ